MEKINEIKLPEGVDRIAVKQYNDKIVIEFISEKPKFKEGDILSSKHGILIFKGVDNWDNWDCMEYYVFSGDSGLYYDNKCMLDIEDFKIATEKEKQHLFDVMEKNGKRWNAEKLKIEDILKKGDWAIFWDNESLKYLIRFYHAKSHSGDGHSDNFGIPWDNAVKWDGTKEQFEKILDME